MLKKATQHLLIKFFFLSIIGQLLAEAISIFFHTQFQTESNHYEIKMHFQTFDNLRYQLIMSKLRLLTVFMTLKTLFHEKNCWYRETQRQVNNTMVSLCCHGNSKVNETQIGTNFRLYIIQMWYPFFDILVKANVVKILKLLESGLQITAGQWTMSSPIGF